MANESGEWIMKGLDWDNPYRIRSWRELINWINEVVFLSLFANEIPALSAERIFERARELFPEGRWTSGGRPFSEDRSGTEIDAALRKVLK